MRQQVYLVVYLDGDWLGYGPLSPELNYGAPPPNMDEVASNMENAIAFMKENVGGKFVFGAHTGSYCRDAFFREPMLSMYRQVVANGGEIAIHPHEEKKAEGNFFTDTAHMRQIVTSKCNELAAVGLKATSFRGAYNGYTPELTGILEENGILVDLSSAPGLENPLWTAHWKGAPLSGHFLCSVNPTDKTCAHPKSKVFEVPMGCDGRGADLNENFLFNENLNVSGLKRVWDDVLARAKADGPQFVHFLAHLHSMGDAMLSERCAKFLAYARETGAQFVTPTEAREIFINLK